MPPLADVLQAWSSPIMAVSFSLRNPTPTRWETCLRIESFLLISFLSLSLSVSGKLWLTMECHCTKKSPMLCLDRWRSPPQQSRPSLSTLMNPSREDAAKAPSFLLRTQPSSMNRSPWQEQTEPPPLALSPEKTDCWNQAIEPNNPHHLLWQLALQPCHLHRGAEAGNPIPSSWNRSVWFITWQKGLRWKNPIHLSSKRRWVGRKWWH